MRKLFFTLMLAVLGIGCRAAGDNKLHVTFDVVNFGDSLTVISSDSQNTFIGKDGKFEFDLDVPQAAMLYFVPPRALRGDLEGVAVYSAPAIPGGQMRLWATGDGRYDVSGEGFYAEYHKLDLMMEGLAKTHTGKDGGFDAALLDYVKAHANEEVSVMTLFQFRSAEKAREAAALLTPEVRQGRVKPLYDDFLARMEQQAAEAEAEAAAASKQAAGVIAPEFTLNDLKGQPLALSSLRGKYVVLDFWGSWCIWCIKGFPKMKEYYAKYPGKFEILGIDCNDTPEKWKAAVEKHQLPWLHVYTPKDSSLLQDYGITGFPTKIIIGPDGKIVKTIVGEDPEFYTYLDSLFGK